MTMPKRLAAATIGLLLLAGATACEYPTATGADPTATTFFLPDPPPPPDAASVWSRGPWVVNGSEAGGDKAHGQLTFDDDCTHPGQDHGERIVVRIDHDGDPDGAPCPHNTIDTDWPAWVVSQPHAGAAGTIVICTNPLIPGDMRVGAAPGTYRAGDICPNGDEL